MKRWMHAKEDIFAMSNVKGKHIKVEKNVPFSFYYSPMNSSHSPRVKPVLNPEKMNLDDAGTLKLVTIGSSFLEQKILALREK